MPVPAPQDLPRTAPLPDQSFRAAQDAGLDGTLPFQSDDAEIIDISGLPFEPPEPMGIEDEGYEFGETDSGGATVRMAGSETTPTQIPGERLERLRKAGEEIGDAMHPARLGILDGAGAGSTGVNISDESALEIAEFVADFMPGLSVPLALNDTRVAAQAAYIAYQSGDLTDAGIAAAIAIVSAAGVVPVVRKVTKFVARSMQAARIRRRERFHGVLHMKANTPRPKSRVNPPPIDAHTFMGRVRRQDSQRGILRDFVGFALNPKAPSAGARIQMTTGMLSGTGGIKAIIQWKTVHGRIFQGNINRLPVIIDDMQVRHAWSRHKDARPGQPGLRQQDFQLLPRILDEAKSVHHKVYRERLLGNSLTDELRFVFEIDGMQYHATFAVIPSANKGKNPAHLRFTSMWISGPVRKGTGLK